MQKRGMIRFVTGVLRSASAMTSGAFAPPNTSMFHPSAPIHTLVRFLMMRSPPRSMISAATRESMLRCASYRVPPREGPLTVSVASRKSSRYRSSTAFGSSPALIGTRTARVCSRMRSA